MLPFRKAVEEMEMKKRLSTESNSHQKGKLFFLTTQDACALTCSTVYIRRNCFNVFWPVSLSYNQTYRRIFLK